MKLKEILSGIEYYCRNFQNLEVRGIAINSNQVFPGYMFVAIRGEEKDGHDFVYEAIERGASVLVVNKGFDQLMFHRNIVVIQVPDTREAICKIAANFYGHPFRFLDIIGITGTNGKTTVSFLLDKIFTYAGYHSGVIGTVCYRIGNREIPSTNTTPDSVSLQKYMDEMVQSGQDVLILEASSHGLAQKRLNGIKFDCGIFTNLGKDHLDYHRDMENYYRAKKILFTELLKDNGVAIINIDDEYGHRLYGEISGEKIRYGFSPQADVRAVEYKMSFKGISFKVDVMGREIKVFSRLLGVHNIYNILAALAVAYRYNIEFSKVLYAIENFTGVRGRLERVFGSSHLKVFVDYAHTPDALENVLSTLRSLKKGRLWVVFGCGGNRYREKRAIMGEIASYLADRVIITSDNPRDENPLDIIEDILTGVKNKDKCEVIPARKEAIEKTIEQADIGDVILIAGKGHERYQIVGNLVIPFDDREIASRALIRRTMREMANVS
ncbi:MAG TPA: UDP-N-acetylmuramoyl-L-alanyl-D-glutamate--2,6-diaminopimelate ligase [Candidatus Omnitrophica bacterium]|nr:UDP-N-acetylmuramoyl-L-alanyl-D-glutamate--2,6-diaminopimelate ligase [Candidatus Omnitrophota bacterium]